MQLSRALWFGGIPQKKRIAYKDLLRWNPAWGSELCLQRQGVAVMSTHGVDVFDKTLQTTHQWLHELESVVGPTSVGIGVEFRPTRFAAKRSASTFYRVFSGFLVKEFCYET